MNEVFGLYSHQHLTSSESNAITRHLSLETANLVCIHLHAIAENRMLEKPKRKYPPASKSTRKTFYMGDGRRQGPANMPRIARKGSNGMRHALLLWRTSGTPGRSERPSSFARGRERVRSSPTGTLVN